MTFEELKFKAENATGVVGVKRVNEQGEFETVERFAPYIKIDDANRILAEKLKRAPVAKLTKTEYGMREWTDSGMLGTLAPTHIARLVCIEELEK